MGKEVYLVLEVVNGNFDTIVYAVCTSLASAIAMVNNSPVNLKVQEKPFILDQENQEKSWIKRNSKEIE